MVTLMIEVKQTDPIYFTLAILILKMAKGNTKQGDTV